MVALGIFLLLLASLGCGIVVGKIIALGTDDDDPENAVRADVPLVSIKVRRF